MGVLSAGAEALASLRGAFANGTTAPPVYSRGAK